MSIWDAITSIFTPPGTNQRNKQVDQQSGYSGSVYNNLWPGLNSHLKQAQGFENSQYPNVEQGVNNAYHWTTQGGRNELANNEYGQLQGNAREQAGQANPMFAGNPGLAKGYGLAAMNNANSQAGAYDANLNSPQGQMGAWTGYSNALARSAPNYGDMGAFNSAIYGQPQVPVGQGIGGFLGSIIPTISGLGGNPLAMLGLAGGGGGGVGSSYGGAPPYTGGSQSVPPVELLSGGGYDPSGLMNII